LAINGIDWAKTPLTLGAWIDLDPKTETVTGVDDATDPAALDTARSIPGGFA
jgi:hypothetical protein